jgi:hypothetical protein
VTEFLPRLPLNQHPDGYPGEAAPVGAALGRPREEQHRQGQGEDPVRAGEHHGTCRAAVAGTRAGTWVRPLRRAGCPAEPYPFQRGRDQAEFIVPADLDAAVRAAVGDALRVAHRRPQRAQPDGVEPAEDAGRHHPDGQGGQGGQFGLPAGLGPRQRGAVLTQRQVTARQDGPGALAVPLRTGAVPAVSRASALPPAGDTAPEEPAGAGGRGLDAARCRRGGRSGSPSRRLAGPPAASGHCTGPSPAGGSTRTPS